MSHNINSIPESQREIFLNMLEKGGEIFYPNISVDVVILGYHDRSLKVLLQKPAFSDKWMLPGGFVLRTQTVEQAAEAVVRDRTRLRDLTLYQCKVFSGVGRDQAYKEWIVQSIEGIGFKAPDNFWLFDSHVSDCFYALTEFSKVRPSGDYYSEECAWHDLAELPPLIYDHREMVDAVMRNIRRHVYFRPIGYNLLPEKFTLPEIHSLYETILNRKLDERNFAKKLVNLGLIVKLKERRNIGAHRSPYLYIFDKARYDQLLEENDAVIL